MNTNVSMKRFLSKILAVSLVIGGSVSARKGMRNNGTQRSLRKRNMYSIRGDIKNPLSLKSIVASRRKNFRLNEQRIVLEKGKKSFSSLEFWAWLTAVGILSGGSSGTVSHFATKKLNNDKQNCYLYLAEKLGVLSKLEGYVKIWPSDNVMSMVNSIMPVYDELCSFASNLSLDFDPEKLEAKFSIKDTGNEFYKSHVSVFNFLKSWTFSFKVGEGNDLHSGRLYVDDIKCLYPDDYKEFRGTRFLRFENNSWEFSGCYGFSQPVPKAYEDASFEQKKNLRCGILSDDFGNLACDVVSEWLLCMWIYPVYNDEGIFDCCIRTNTLCCKFISDLMKAVGLYYI